MTTETISKIDIACRHLDTAITLWFQESDPVSIHLLACASHEIISDIIRHRGGSDPLFDSPYIKPGFKAVAKNHFHDAYNFFKHADRDPESSIQFNSLAPQYLIVYSALGLEQLAVKNTPIRFAFFLYFGFHNPDLMGEDGFKAFTKDFHIEVFPELQLPRRVFFEKLEKELKAIAR